MIVLDANLLVYAYATPFPQHDAARTWLDAQFDAAPRVGLPWSSLLAFVRLVTNPRLFSEPASVPTARAQVEAWLDADLAALAVEHGLRLATSDSGFARFPQLEWFNPLR